ncbi:hypothetical protein [Parasphingorhabdus sp. NYA22]
MPMNRWVLTVFGDDDFGRAAANLDFQTRVSGGDIDKSKLNEPDKVLHQTA